MQHRYAGIGFCITSLINFTVSILTGLVGNNFLTWALLVATSLGVMHQAIQTIGEVTEKNSLVMAEASKELHFLGEQLEQLARLSTDDNVEETDDLF